MMARLRLLALLLLAGCAPASDGVLLRGEPLSGLPDAWLCWRTVPPPTSKGGPTPLQLYGGSGLVVYHDGRAEAVARTPAWGNQGARTLRRQGTVSAVDRSDLEKALAGPIAPAVRPPRKARDGGLAPETESAGGSYEVEVREADGTVRRVSYQHRSWPEGASGGEPLHPLLLRILNGLPE